MVCPGVPAAADETPAWSLCGESRDGKLILSNGSRRSEAVPLDQPFGIVRLLERQQRLAELLDTGEEPHPEQGLFQRADEPLGAALASGARTKAGALSMPRKR